MKYQIYGNPFPAAEVTLNKGEEVFTQSSALSWMDENVTMDTNTHGGFLKSVGRMFSGASLMFVTHSTNVDNSKITFTSSFPGAIQPFEIDENHQYYAQKSAFLVADKGVEVESAFSKKALAGIFGGEGIILQKFTGKGTVLAEIDGSVKEIDLKPGEVIKVSTSHVAVFESSVSYDVQAVKGLSNILFSGQGLFLTTLTGPGKVWLQTLTAGEMAEKLIPYIPQSSSSSSND